MIQKYSDGTCAKWCYNTNNNITDGEEEYTVHRKEPVKYFDGEILHGTNDLLDRLNEYECENERLKSENDKFRSFIRRNHAIGMIHRILTGDVE